MGEDQFTVIDAVEAHLVTHVFYYHTCAGFHLGVTDSHDEGVHSLILAFDNSLSKDNSIVGVTGTIGDPVLLGKGSGAVDYEFFSLLIISSSSFHLHCIIAVSEFCETEAAHVCEIIDLGHELLVTIGGQGHQSTAKQVELHSELSC